MIVMLLMVNGKLYGEGKTGPHFDEIELAWKDAIGMESLNDEELLGLWKDCIRKYGCDQHAYVLFSGYMSRVWAGIKAEKYSPTPYTIKMLKEYANNILDVDVLCEIMMETE